MHSCVHAELPDVKLFSFTSWYCAMKAARVEDPAAGDPRGLTGKGLQCRYTSLLRDREGNDRQVHGESQTLNPLLKAKETQTEARSTSTAECQVGLSSSSHPGS